MTNEVTATKQALEAWIRGYLRGDRIEALEIQEYPDVMNVVIFLRVHAGVSYWYDQHLKDSWAKAVLRAFANHFKNNCSAGVEYVVHLQDTAPVGEQP